MAKDVERSQDLLRLVNIGPRRRNGVSSQTLWAPNSISPESSPPGPSPSSLHKNTPSRTLYRYHARAARGRTSDTARITRLRCGSRAAYRSDRDRLDSPLTRRQVTVHN